MITAPAPTRRRHRRRTRSGRPRGRASESASGRRARGRAQQGRQRRGVLDLVGTICNRKSARSVGPRAYGFIGGGDAISAAAAQFQRGRRARAAGRDAPVLRTTRPASLSGGRGRIHARCRHAEALLSRSTSARSRRGCRTRSLATAPTSRHQRQGVPAQAGEARLEALPADRVGRARPPDAVRARQGQDPVQLLAQAAEAHPRAAAGACSTAPTACSCSRAGRARRAPPRRRAVRPRQPRAHRRDARDPHPAAQLERRRRRRLRPRRVPNLGQAGAADAAGGVARLADAGGRAVDGAAPAAHALRPGGEGGGRARAALSQLAPNTKMSARRGTTPQSSPPSRRAPRRDRGLPRRRRRRRRRRHRLQAERRRDAAAASSDAAAPPTPPERARVRADRIRAVPRAAAAAVRDVLGGGGRVLLPERGGARGGGVREPAGRRVEEGRQDSRGAGGARRGAPREGGGGRGARPADRVQSGRDRRAARARQGALDGGMDWERSNASSAVSEAGRQLASLVLSSTCATARSSSR